MLLNLSTYDEVESSKALNNSESDHKSSTYPIGFLSMFYIVGIIGSFVALLHLCQTKNFRNTKQAFMLKCLMMLDLVGLLGMLSQSFIKTSLNGQEFNNFYRNHIHIFCSAILVWRFFGISSGCVAFIMAVDRYFALTKPFYYCQHFTNGLIKRLISIMWLSCALLTFAPILGFGKFCDDRERKCERYRDAHETLDVIYAWLFFIVGSCLCIFMVLCNFQVTRIVYLSSRNIRKLNMSFMENNNDDNINNNMERNRCHRISISTVSKKSNLSSTGSRSPPSLVTRDELKFIKMSNWLTATFVVTWGAQMITIPIAQLFVKSANQSDAIGVFFQIADFLLLIHFTMDPYIYVLSRTNYWIRFKHRLSIIREDVPKVNDDFAELTKMDRNRRDPKSFVK